MNSTATPAIGGPALPLMGTNDLVQPRKPAIGKSADPAQAKKAGEDFEAMFLSQMLAPMFDQLKTDGPFGGGSGESMYRSFMVDAVAQSMTKAGGIGIAASVQREILKLQEATNGQ